MPSLYVINGPNLNLLGTREPKTYGRATLKDVQKLCETAARKHGWQVEFRQSNVEGELVDFVQEAGRKKAAGIVINPAGYTTTSIAIMDALLGVGVPAVEVHISNIHAREKFRHHSLISRAARGVICGMGVEGYALAIDGLASLVGGKNPVKKPVKKSGKK
jgi:3-dehydroquinate dehydratase-2